MKYHPDIELLLKYSTGQLAPALSVAIGLHQHECEVCQQRVADLESVGGDTLESLPDQPTETIEGFDQLMAEISEMPQELESKEYEDCAVAEPDMVFVELLGKREFGGFKWQKLTPRISKAVVDIGDELHQVELLKFAPKAKIPKHTHCGKEFTLVLDGDFSDAVDSYREGEFIVQDQSHEHQPIAGEHGCICLAITSAPLKFTGTFGPVLNWLTRE